MNEIKIGSRIRLVDMSNDPDPIEPGSTGTVLGICHLSGWTSITVDWDNGRALGLCTPPDIFEILPDEQHQSN